MRFFMIFYLEPVLALICYFWRKFGAEILPTYDMLEDFVMQLMLTDAGRAMAQTFLAAGRAQAQFAMYMSNNDE